jgi:hypothetical protein
LDTCKKIIAYADKGPNEAYVIYMADLFAEAAKAFQSGENLAQVMSKTGLSSLALTELMKDPGLRIEGEILAKLIDLAWIVDESEM